MKKEIIKITIVLGLFCITTFAHAQGISFGAKAGVNLASLSGDFGAGYEKSMLTGFHVGAIVDIGITDQFSIIPEVLYSMKGVKASYDESEPTLGITITGEEKVKLSYIDIPILATYKMESGLHFELGPYIGLVMSADDDATGTASIAGFPSVEIDTSYSIKDDVESMDIGLAFGLGYTLESGLGFSARYSMGMTDINKDTGSSGSTSEANKNAVIGISISYMFGKD